MLRLPPGFPVHRTGRLLAGALAGLLGCGGRETLVVERALEATGDTVLTPYGNVTDAAWLEGSRWVVIAPEDRAVALVDLARHTTGQFGGPAASAFDQPFHLFRAGDSIYVADWARRRLTTWSPAGKPGGAVAASDRLRGALPKARDAVGRWYFELRPPPGPDGAGNRDSAVIARVSSDGARIDTVARLAPFDLAEVVTDGRRRLERRLLSGQDRWGVRPDGTVWVARVTPNRVDWHNPAGGESLGRELPDPVLPVTENDRELFLRRFGPELREPVEQIPFAAIKPPFEAALADPEGRVWLVKSRAIGDTLRRYQAVDAGGRLVERITHRGLGRVLALGGGLALVGEPYAEGTRLLLYRLSTSPGTGPASPS